MNRELFITVHRTRGGAPIDVNPLAIATMVAAADEKGAAVLTMIGGQPIGCRETPAEVRALISGDDAPPQQTKAKGRPAKEADAT